MKRLKNMRKSIRFKLLMTVLMLSIVMTLFTAAIRFYAVYRDSLQTINKQMHHLQASYIPSLINSLWMMDKEQLQIQLAGMVHLPYLHQVSIYSEKGVVISSASSGTWGSKHSVVQRVPLSMRYNGQEVFLGTFEAVASLQPLQMLLGKGLTETLLVEGLKILLLMAGILLIFHLMVTRHLLAMAAYAGNLDFQGSYHPLVLQRRSSAGGYQDELDEVVIALNTALKRLSISFMELTAVNTRLEGEISERKCMVEALRESEERYRHLFDDVRDGMALAEAETGILVDCNRAMCQTLERTRAELLGQPQSILHPPQAITGERSLTFRQFQEVDSPPLLEDLLMSKTGKLIPVEIRAAQVEMGSGKYLLGVFRDITERKRAEGALRASREFTEIVLNSLSDLLCVIDVSDFTIVSANKAFCDHYGHETNAIIGKRCYELTHNRSTPCTPPHDPCPLAETARTGKMLTMEHLHYGKDGQGCYFEVSTFPIRNAQGEIYQIVHIARETTERRKTLAEKQRMESQLQQVQKMEAIGTLAGGIAHDFNNLLTGILGHANLLTLNNAPGSPVHESARTIEQAAERASELTQQLLGFARRGKFQVQSVDIHALILNVVQLLGRTFDRSIVLTQRFSAGTPLVLGDPGQLQQVLMNLSVNARDAMEQGGEFSFMTEVADLDDAYCQAHVDANPGKYLKISVTDTGVGIPREHQGRIFEPFFTTKEQGKGTGMGLAMVYGIVKNHGGHVSVYSELGRGTTFNVFLPLEDRAEKREEKPVAEDILSGTGRILVIDDEEMIRDLAAEMLKSLGYDVATASDGEAGVRLYREENGQFDLVIIDMVMPKLGGHDCFLALKQINPNIRVILSTGYGINGKAQEILDEGVMGFIQKPYRIAHFSQVIKEAKGRSITPLPADPVGA